MDQQIIVANSDGASKVVDAHNHKNSKWRPFYHTCRSYACAAIAYEKEIRVSAERMVWAKWSLGVMVRDGGGDYGDRIVDKLADELKADGIQGFDRREIHYCLRFATMFPDVPSVEELLANGFSWWGIKRKVLPDKHERQEQAIDGGMKSKEDIRQAIQAGIPDEEKPGIIAFLEADMSESAELIARIVPGQVGQIVVGQQQFQELRGDMSYEEQAERLSAAGGNQEVAALEQKVDALEKRLEIMEVMIKQIQSDVAHVYMREG